MFWARIEEIKNHSLLVCNHDDYLRHFILGVGRVRRYNVDLTSNQLISLMTIFDVVRDKELIGKDIIVSRLKQTIGAPASAPLATFFCIVRKLK